MTKEITFRISRFQFWIVALLILMLPISSKYKLIVRGEKTTGKVIEHKKVVSGRLSGYDTYSVIEFRADSLTIRMYGPENTIYDLGDSITVFYNKKDPKNCMILSLTYIYTGRGAIIPLVLLLIWIAFYTAFKDKGNSKPTAPNTSINSKESNIVISKNLRNPHI